MRKHTLTTLSLVLLFLLVAVRGNAAPLLVSSSGAWGAAAPTSLWTAPGAVWTFSFLVESNPTITSSWSTGFNPPYSAFQYTLNGSSVATAPAAIAFNTNSTLVVSFGSGTGFQLFGPPAFFGPTSAPTIVPGSYIAMAQPNTVFPYFEINSNFIQDLTGTVVTIRPASVSVPESPTWAVMVGAILALYVRRRTLARLSQAS